MADRLRSIGRTLRGLPLVHELVQFLLDVGSATRRAWWRVCGAVGRSRLGQWAGRWRRVIIPTTAIVVAVGTLTLLLVLSNRADQTQLSTTLQGLDDDRCIRQFSADASEHRTELVDAQARVTVETQRTTARLAEGLIAGLLRDDDAAVMVAVAALGEAIDAGDEQVELVTAAALRAGAAEQRLRQVSAASRDDRELFARLCARAP